jgi:pimeloyl-ACP methyl ester carboxylesterase
MQGHAAAGPARARCRLITGLGARPCVLAGHSWGGILVQLLAFRRPHLAAGLVLVDPS